MREMMGMLVIRVEMRGIGVGMLEIRWKSGWECGGNVHIGVEMMNKKCGEC